MSNEITCDYKNVTCIKKMDPTHLTAFELLVNEYGPRLLSKIQTYDSVFTLHNFNEHCFGIYKMISHVLLDEAIVYEGPYSLTQTELYILNLAVLFHDIGMSECLTFKRENHSVKSAEYIDKIWENKESVFAKHCLLSQNEIEALKCIIIAHSDIKDSTVNPEDNGLFSPKLDAELMDKNRKLIRTRFLAGVLRVADELDITSERLGNSDLEQALGYWTAQELNKNVSLEEKKQIEGLIISLNHWKRLHYISFVDIQKESETIKIIVDDNAVNKAQREGTSLDELIDILNEIVNEIDKKLGQAYELCFSKSDLRKCIQVKHVSIISNIEVIQNELSIRESRCQTAN